MGPWIKGEDDRLDPAAPRAMQPSLAAIGHLERAVAEASDLEGLVLRYGTSMGPAPPSRSGESTPS